MEGLGLSQSKERKRGGIWVDSTGCTLVLVAGYPKGGKEGKMGSWRNWVHMELAKSWLPTGGDDACLKRSRKFSVLHR